MEGVATNKYLVEAHLFNLRQQVLPQIFRHLDLDLQPSTTSLLISTSNPDTLSRDDAAGSLKVANLRCNPSLPPPAPAMAPLVEAFHPARLQQHVQYRVNGNIRKEPVDLKQCELRELIQYECNLKGPKDDPRSKVVCESVLRLFRKCVGNTVAAPVLGCCVRGTAC